MMKRSGFISIARDFAGKRIAFPNRFVAVLVTSACGALASNSGAIAEQVLVTSAGVYSDNTLNFDGTPTISTVIGITLQGSNAIQWVFCVDFDHYIPVYLGSQYPLNPPLAYSTAPILTNSIPSAAAGTLLTLSQQQEIQYLASFGIGLANAGGNPTSWSSTLLDELTAVQGAIWKVEYNFTVSGGQGNQLALLSQYVLNAQNYIVANPDAPRAQGLFSPDAASPANFYQGFVTAGDGLVTAGVPELSTWAMMLLGFGVLGFATYRRTGKIVSIAGRGIAAAAVQM